MMHPDLLFPPLSFIPPAFPQIVFSVVVALLTLPVVLMAISHWRKTGSPVEFVVIVGSVLTSIMEPISNVMFFIYHGEDNITAFTALYRKIPWWVVIASVNFYGATAVILWRMFRREDGISQKTFWSIIGGLIIANVLIEVPMLQLGIYTYYGPQAYQVFGIPLWWLTVNLQAPIVTAALLTKLGPWLTGPRALLAGLIPCMIYPAVIQGTAFPMYAAMNSGATVGMLQLIAPLTTALTLLVLYTVSKWVCGRPT